MKKVMTSEEEKAASELLLLVDSIIKHLVIVGVDLERSYSYLRKVRNILVNGSENGYKNIESHLFMDFRMIYDNRMDDERLGKMMEEAYSIVENNSIFNY
jgi:hypothetical protein